MKVSTRLIPENEKENVQLFIHEETPEFEHLKAYIEMERFRPQILLGNKGEEVCRIPISAIFYIESVQEIQYIHASQGIYTTRQRLYMLKQQLPEYFFRASKSAILNLEMVQSYKPLSGGRMFAVFPNGDGTYISRKYVRELKEQIRRKG